MALVVLVIIGFRADASQKEAIEDVPELVDNVIEWKDDVCKCLMLCVVLWSCSVASLYVVWVRL